MTLRGTTVARVAIATGLTATAAMIVAGGVAVDRLIRALDGIPAGAPIRPPFGGEKRCPRPAQRRRG